MTRRPVLIGLLVLAVFVAAFLTSARRTGGPPLDPTSTAADGARGVVELVDGFGAGMAVLDAPPGDDVDTALVLADRFDRDAAAALVAWVEAGGTLVVADPGSALTPPIRSVVLDEVAVECADPALAGVTALAVGDGRGYEVPADATSCTTDGEGSLVVVQSLGAGAVVSVGSVDVFTNERLDEADNAVLAVSLLAPDPGSRSAFLRSVVVGGGERSLVDLIDDPVRAAGFQLLVAFGIVVAWRARRLGRPVTEANVVEIESTELTRAVGRLLATSRRPDRAAAALRDRARRELSGPLGLPLDAPTSLVVDVIATRTSLTAADARRAVADPVTDDDALASVAALLVRIREEITHGPATL